MPKVPERQEVMGNLPSTCGIRATVVRPEGLEPPTDRVETGCSIR